MKRTLAAIAAATAALAAPAASHAAAVIAPPQAVTGGFAPKTPVMVEGGSLDLTNLDFVDHTFTSASTEPSGFPTWGSDFAKFGDTVPVRGVERLAPGSYTYICIFHPDITGTLVVVPGGPTTIKGGTR